MAETLLTGKILALIQHIRPGLSQDGDDGEQEYHTVINSNILRDEVLVILICLLLTVLALLLALIGGDGYLTIISINLLIIIIKPLI